MIKKLFALGIALFSSGYTEEIVLWHAFDGPLEAAFVEIVEDFNHHSGTHKVIPIRKGNYKEVVEKGLEAFEKGEQPHLLQVYEVATLTMMYTPEVFVSVDELMHKHNKKFDPDVYIDAVRNFYSTAEGKMLSFPWNASTGILFYNKDAFTKAGLDPEKPPKTWEELESYAQKCVTSGLIGFTTAWPAAYHLEHLSCWHNLPFSSLGNGFQGLGTRLIFNRAEQIFHLTKLTEWQKKGVFSYSGRFTTEPEQLFTSGKCAILLQGANRLPLLKQQAKFPIGVGFMPYWSQIVKKPYNLNIGGASFWVMSGFKESTYQGIAQFLEYLSSTSIQAYWHQKTGYLPITEAAYYLTKKKGFYQTHPAEEIAVLEVMGSAPTEHTKGVRLGNYLTIRDRIVDYLEKAFSGEISPKEALDGAVQSGNQLLETFEKENVKPTEPSSKA
jgi:sn-glycerol 3-phosphate transport system substrate-binding protein